MDMAIELVEEAEDLTKEIEAINRNEQDTELADGRQDQSLRQFPELVTGGAWTCTLKRTAKGTEDVMLDLLSIRQERITMIAILSL